MRKKPPATIDDYIAACRPEVRPVLRAVRRAVRKGAPNASEVISYRMPALLQHGILVFFAAFRNHIGFFPPIRGDARLQSAAARYAGPKGNLRFPLAEPMPLALITRLTKLRAKQDAKAGAAHRRAKRR